MAGEEKIVIRQIGKPGKESQEALLQYFCQVFDIGTKKGDDVEPTIFKEIVASSINGSGVTSKVLNEKLSVPRSTVIYHLNRFIYSGLVVRKGRKYYLRSDDMESTMQELQADIEREFSRLIEFAQKMDTLFEENAYGRRKGRRQ
ncbi:MAG: hypothetical protein KGI00_00325 [Candidatus Micrarchaeota archaeon]|nr:hypothetical protein [Candidatus Micrarchaeota archaeon]MDE1823946.1 hypothetical protein [Candidatus Micrarchaeota archaeon]MDE1849160.1 hypothetical protein [Candidatus Micrarchaeota archaeon]